VSERYSISEVCAVLDLKPHVVRYWEQSIELLSPSKSLAGRRLYTSGDLQLLARVKHLVQDLHYTVPGAAARLMEERSGSRPDAHARINEIRHELFTALQKLRAHMVDNQSNEVEKSEA
jgi:DNA-binding transcriptional MerR regulator